MSVIQYEHHNVVVSVQEHLKGKHREHCLCYQDCIHFKPNTPNNCKIAQELYELDVKLGLTTPVWECPVYEEDKP